MTRGEAEALRDRCWAEAKLSGQVPTIRPRPKPNVEPDSVTVAEVIATAWRWVEDYYGSNSQEPENFKTAFRPVLAKYADIPADAFGPLALKVIQQDFVAAGYCRKTINRHTIRIRRAFKVAAEFEVVDAAIWHRLQVVPGLKRGRTTAHEPEPRHPAPDHLVDAIKPHVSKVVWAMVQTQRLTGARPTELCEMRAADFDMSGTVWMYRPTRHKTMHHGHTRQIAIGPKGQEIIRPFLTGDPTKFLFDPRDAVAQTRAERRAKRKTPLKWGNKKGTNRKARPERVAGDHYHRMAYWRAVQRGCDKAFPVPDEINAVTDPSERAKQIKEWRVEHRFHPHQLRHAFATTVRREHGLEAAQVLLGHATADVTQVYAERDQALAIAVAREVG